MPLYEYRCPKCGHEFEAWNKIARRASATCTKCGGSANKKLSAVNNTFGFRLSEKSNQRFARDGVERDI
jgi:putative FmdB family regulatory protein